GWFIAAGPGFGLLAVAPQLPADRRGASADRTRYGAQRFTVCVQTVNLDPFAQIELLVMFSHRSNTLEVLHLFRELREPSFSSTTNPLKDAGSPPSRG